VCEPTIESLSVELVKKRRRDVARAATLKPGCKDKLNTFTSRLYTADVDQARGQPVAMRRLPHFTPAQCVHEHDTN
jgi:hypothetical protein